MMSDSSSGSDSEAEPEWDAEQQFDYHAQRARALYDEAIEIKVRKLTGKLACENYHLRDDVEHLRTSLALARRELYNAREQIAGLRTGTAIDALMKRNDELRTQVAKLEQRLAKAYSGGVDFADLCRATVNVWRTAGPGSS